MKTLIPLALAAGMAAAVVAAGPAVASTAPIQLTFRTPTGPDQTGTVSLHLVQAGRPDPWVPGRTRELMISLTYPARHAGRYPTAPYMEAGAYESFQQNPDTPVGSALVPQTAAHEGAPVARQPGGLPATSLRPSTTPTATMRLSSPADSSRSGSSRPTRPSSSSPARSPSATRTCGSCWTS